MEDGGLRTEDGEEEQVKVEVEIEIAEEVIGVPSLPLPWPAAARRWR
jgi:hypothetical protein